VAKKKDKFGVDDFNQIPNPILDNKTGDLLSFVIKSKKIDVPDNLCEVHISEVSDLSIIKSRGRQSGTDIFYSLDNVYNYQSQSQRYDRAVSGGILPATIRTENGKTCYLFCSSTAEGGFYEVCIDEKDLSIKFLTNPLVIVCPRPFQLNDLSVLETTATWVKFTVLQGRETIISPNDGSAATLNPFISIIGSRKPNDPPILILAEAEGSTAIFDILAIDTTITERIVHLSGADDSRTPPNLSIPCKLRLLPSIANTGQCGTSATSINASWFFPIANVPDIIGYMPQVNDGGVWRDLLPQISPIQSIFIESEKSYRVLTFFKIFGNKVIADSCVLRFEQVPTFATDAINAISGQCGIFESRYYQVLAQVIDVFDLLKNISGQCGIFESRQYQITALVQDVFENTGNFSGQCGIFEARQYALGGIIAG
jgi:hypothetical protein